MSGGSNRRLRRLTSHRFAAGMMFATHFAPRTGHFSLLTRPYQRNLSDHRCRTGGKTFFRTRFFTISNTVAPAGVLSAGDTMLDTMTLPDLTTFESDDHGGATNEARLVDEARRGSKSSFGELVTRYERRLIRVILQFVKNIELAEDLAQETFIKAYERLEQFDPARRFGPWLFRIGVNQTLDYLRRRKRRGWWHLFTDHRGEKQPDPATADPRQALDLQQEVEAVLEQIPENYRMVLMLRDLQNFSTSEIASMLGRKEATIRWRLAEARRMFEEIWVKRRDGDPVSGREAEHEPDSPTTRDK